MPLAQSYTERVTALLEELQTSASPVFATGVVESLRQLATAFGPFAAPSKTSFEESDLAAEALAAVVVSRGRRVEAESKASPVDMFRQVLAQDLEAGQTISLSGMSRCFFLLTGTPANFIASGDSVERHPVVRANSASGDPLVWAESLPDSGTSLTVTPVAGQTEFHLGWSGSRPSTATTARPELKLVRIAPIPASLTALHVSMTSNSQWPSSGDYTGNAVLFLIGAP